MDNLQVQVIKQLSFADEDYVSLILHMLEQISDLDKIHIFSELTFKFDIHDRYDLLFFDMCPTCCSIFSLDAIR
jgi:hypothetical protein